MLRITVDLIPFGIEVNKKTISEITIANTRKKNKYNEYTYKYSGWIEHEPVDDRELNEMFGMHEFKGTVEHDRRKMVYFLIHKIIIKVIKPYGCLY